LKALEFSVAGKTFMAGEYLALTGGPALILATEPRFKLFVQPGLESQNPFHPQSPAGQFCKTHSTFFSQFQLRFEDPYRVGGFGASSAQFALLHAFWQAKEEAFGESERFFDWHQMLLDYRSLAYEGSPPSGADVIGAVSGGLTWFDRLHGKLQTFAWPFSEHCFFVAHTGQKLATHEHLKNLGSFETAEFENAMQVIHRGLTLINFEEFLEGLRSYRTQLEKQNRVVEFTLQKVKTLSQNQNVLFAKGCGAMGSDVILVFCRKEHSHEVSSLIAKEQLLIVADSSKVSPGLKIQSLALNPKEISL
jgi:mevalonate kinase